MADEPLRKSLSMLIKKSYSLNLLTQDVEASMRAIRRAVYRAEKKEDIYSYGYSTD